MRNQKMQERIKSKPFQDMESVVITTANLGSLRTSILQRAAIFSTASDFLPTPAISCCPDPKNITFVWRMCWRYYWHSVNENLRKRGTL